jgi:NAD(P)-dependent dehydrogenase (short-subunit alcohol dehydrogenase family)
LDLGTLMRGRHVLVTGASSGLGQHFARLCAKNGATVTVGARRRDRLEALVRDLLELGAEGAKAVDLDVTDTASVAHAIASAGAAAPLDVVVNNAGVPDNKPALDIDEALYDTVVDTNVKGVWAVSTEAARAWREAGRGGVIVNIASILGRRVSGAVSVYATTKAAVVQMTAAHALEWARYGIRVNALAPGYIATEINDEFFQSEPGQALIKRIPMRRLGRMEDLDAPFLLLATDASPWMTGSCLAVDGGHLVSGL